MSKEALMVILTVNFRVTSFESKEAFWLYKKDGGSHLHDVFHFNLMLSVVYKALLLFTLGKLLNLKVNLLVKASKSF